MMMSRGSGSMIRRITIFLILLAALLPTKAVFCKSNCEVMNQALVSTTPPACCPHSNDQVQDNDEPALGTSARSERPSPDSDCCRLDSPFPYALQPHQASPNGVLQFRVPMQFAYFTLGGEPSPGMAMLEARGGSPQRAIPLGFTPLRI